MTDTHTTSLPSIDRAGLEAAIGRTWFDLQEEDKCFELSTRENGDVGEEECGEADITEARRIIKAIRAKYPAES